MKIIRGKRALVTGSASGIGRCIALELARRGADLTLLDVDPDGLAAVGREVRSLGTPPLALVCDLTQPQEVDGAAARLLADRGGLELLVNCAGVGHYGATEWMTQAQWDRVLAVNLLAPVRLVRLLVPALLASGDGHILNIASVYGLMGERKMVAYSTSKFGLVGLSEALWSEFGGRGLGVTVVCPGYVKTPLFIRASSSCAPDRPMPTPPDWLCASAESIAATAVRAVERNRRIVVVTPLARVVWYMQRWAPWLAAGLKRLRWVHRRRRSVGAATGPQNEKGVGV